MRRRAAWIALAIFAACLLYIGAHHEPWRDEADSWITARDNDIPGLYQRLRHMGTPGLWQLSLMLPAKLGAPYFAMELLNAAFVIGAAALVLFSAPFPLATRALLTFSYYLAFEFGIVARSYGLMTLLLFACAALHRERYRHPVAYGALAGLAMNTCPHGALVAGALLLATLPDLRRREARIVLVVAAIGGAAAFLQLLPPEGGQMKDFAEVTALATASTLAKEVIAPFGWLNDPAREAAGAALNVLGLGAALFLARKDRRALVVFAVSSVLLFVLYWRVYYGGRRHAGIVFVGLVVTMWIAERTKERAAGLLVHAALLASVVFTGVTWWRERGEAFSGAEEMGRYIVEAGLGEAEIAAYPEHVVIGVVPYLPRRPLWYAGRGEYGTWLRWDHRQNVETARPYGDALERIVTAYRGRPPPLILLAREWSDPESLGYRLAKATTRPIFARSDERFYLYIPRRNL